MAVSKLSKPVTLKLNGTNQTAFIHGINAFSGRRPENVKFELLAPGRNKVRFDNRQMAFQNAICQVSIAGTWVHYGRIVKYEAIKSSTGGTRKIYTSRFDDHLFGLPLYSCPVSADASFSEVVEAVGVEPVANPIHDGRLQSNRLIAASSGVAFDHATFFTAEQLFRRPSDIHQRSWSLDYAVRFLCAWLNANETHINNPTYAEISAIIPFDQELMRNVKFKMGSYLPEALDSLLQPFGYGWKVNHISETERKIEVYPRGNPARVTLTNPTDGSRFTFDHDAIEWNISTDLVANSVTGMIVLGAPHQVETTIELSPDWDYAKENQSANEYRLNNELWKTDAALADVYRRWTVVPRNGQPSRSGMDATAWENIFGTFDPFFTRRKFLPCITKNQQYEPFGKFGGCFIEYGVRSGSEIGADLGLEGDWEWIPIEGPAARVGAAVTDTNLSNQVALKNGQSVEILKDELGVYFNGSLPPLTQQQLGRNGFRLRITGTVESIVRNFVIRDFAQSQLVDDRYAVVSMPSGFPYRRLNDSVLAGRADAIYDGVVDSDTELETFADSILERQGLPSTSGTIVLPGLRPDVRNHIGKSLEKIAGLELSMFNGVNYPTIDAWACDIQGQTTTIVLSDPK